MRLSTWLFIIGGAWILIENVGIASAAGNPFTAIQPTLVKIDNMIPGNTMLPNQLPAGGTALLVSGAIARWGFGK